MVLDLGSELEHLFEDVLPMTETIIPQIFLTYMMNKSLAGGLHLRTISFTAIRWEIRECVRERLHPYLAEI